DRRAQWSYLEYVPVSSGSTQLVTGASDRPAVTSFGIDVEAWVDQVTRVSGRSTRRIRARRSTAAQPAPRTASTDRGRSHAGGATAASRRSSSQPATTSKWGASSDRSVR